MILGAIVEVYMGSEKTAGAYGANQATVCLGWHTYPPMILEEGGNILYPIGKQSSPSFKYNHSPYSAGVAWNTCFESFLVSKSQDNAHDVTLRVQAHNPQRRIRVGNATLPY